MTLDLQRTAILGLHWQVNVIKPDGFFGPMLAEPVAASGVVERAFAFHQAMSSLGVAVIYTRFTIPEGEGLLVRNTDFMTAVAGNQAAFRPESPGAQIIPEMSEAAAQQHVADNQKLSGLAGSDVPVWLEDWGVDTILITGVATNLTVEQTARHGTDLGFTIHVMSDCVAAANPEVHEASLANLELVTAGCRSSSEVLALI